MTTQNTDFGEPLYGQMFLLGCHFFWFVWWSVVTHSGSTLHLIRNNHISLQHVDTAFVFIVVKIAVNVIIVLEAIFDVATTVARISIARLA
jgi:hypothetical protein